MCNAPTASLATQAISGIGDAAASIFAASSDKRALKLKAYFADLNADSAMDDARETMRQGDFLETRQRLETANIKSKQRAAMGGNNVDMTEGSALRTLVSTDYIGETDAIIIRQNATRSAAESRARASGLRGEATTSRAAAAGISPLLAGVTSLVGSAGKVAASWYQFDQKGAFGKKTPKPTMQSAYGARMGPA